MRTMNAAVLIGLGAAMLAGCEKKLELTFVNATHEERNVELTVPGEGPEMLGTLGGMGSKLYTKVHVPQSALPTTLSWQAGDIHGVIPVSKNTSEKLLIPVDRNGTGPIDNSTDIRHQQKSQTHEKVQDGAVIE